MTAGPRTDYRDVVAALREVPGVAEADVQPDGEGGLGVLRLGLDPGVDEVEVATRVGRLLRERFNLGIDAERVEIIEDADLASDLFVAEDADLAADTVVAEDADLGADTFVAEREPSIVKLVPAQLARPTIHRMHLVSSGLEVTATVSLASGNRVLAGEARGAASPSGVQRAVAQATLRAVEELLDGAVRFELDHLDVSAVGSDRTVVVSVTMVSERGAERLTGAAAVREDVRQAVIRGTLDALNRRLEALLT